MLTEKYKLKDSDQEDIQRILDDIFRDGAQYKKSLERYARDKQTAENDLKMLIYNNYKTFISLSDNISGVQSFFGNLKKQFSQYDDILNTLEDVLIENKKAFGGQKKMTGLFDTSKDFDDFDEEDLIEKIKRRKETLGNPSPIKSFIDVEEQIREKLDSFEIFLYEKNYKECSRLFSALDSIRTANSTSETFDDFETGRSIDYCYKKMVDSIMIDLSSEALTNQKELLEILDQIGQKQKAVLAFLNLESKKYEETFKLATENLRLIESEIIEKLASDFCAALKKSLRDFQSLFVSKDKGQTGEMASFISWIYTEAQKFYTNISSYIFGQTTLELSMSYFRTIMTQITSIERDGINITNFLQRLCINDVELDLDGMFDLLSENLHLCLLNEEWRIYYLHQIIDLLDFNNESSSLNAINDVGFRESYDLGRASIQRSSTSGNDMTFSGPREFSLKSIDSEYVHIKIYEIIQSQDYEFKFSKSINLFWNTFFYVLDMCYATLDMDTMPVLSAHLFSTFLLRFLDLALKFWDSYFEQFMLAVSTSEDFFKTGLTTYIHSKLIADELNSLGIFKFPRLYAKNNIWIPLIQKINIQLEKIMIAFSKFFIISRIPKALAESVSEYLVKGQVAEIKTPSQAAINLVYNIDKVDNLLKALLPERFKNRTVQKTVLYTMMILEYCLRYLQTDSQKKNEINFDDFATMMPKIEIEKLELDFNGLNMFLMKKNFKLRDFTGAGFCQLIFDINFIAYFYITKLTATSQDKAHIDASFEVNPTKLIDKFVKIYSTEYKRDPKDFEFDLAQKKKYFAAYLTNEYPKFYAEREKALGKDSIGSRNSSLSAKYSFGKILD